jgi:outer membrane autotransporter protein
MNGSGTLNLTGTQVTANGATYRVTAGTGTLNADSETLLGNVLEADGSGTALALNLTHQTAYTGVPLLQGGATASMSIDASSSWNLTGDAALTSLSNQGNIDFGGTPVALQAQAASAPTYRTLAVSGDYTGGGTLNMRTELNGGGAVGDQHTDRLLIIGNVSGTTTITLTPSGSGADTQLGNTPISATGISLVQVKGQSSADAFKLAQGYVAAGAYQYRLFDYGPGSVNGAPSQSLLSNGQTPDWDYRLQTTCVDPDGAFHPAGASSCSSGDNNNHGHTALVPQASSYLSAPLALQNYEAVIMDNLVRRLGDVRRDRYEQPDDTAEMFVRTLNDHSAYAPDRGFGSDQYNFNQNINALQIGGNWLHLTGANQDLRLGGAVTTGSTSLSPKTPQIEGSQTSFTTHNVALTATWRNAEGWFADGVIAGGHYSGTVQTDASRHAGTITANGRDLSLEVGRNIPLAHGFEIEPDAQVLGQSLSFRGRQDLDGVYAHPGNFRAWTGRLGVRLAMPVAGTVSWMPYVRVDYRRTWMGRRDSQLADQSFVLAQPGSGIQLGMGASGMISTHFSLYGEVSGQGRSGRYGFSGIEGTLGLRYRF